MLEAVRLNPANAGYWLELGKIYSQRRDDPYEYINRSLPLADRCYDFSISYAPNDSGILYDVASYWVMRSVLLTTKNDEISTKIEIGTLSQENGIQKFQQLFQRSLGLNPNRWKEAADRVWEYYPEDRIVIGIVPEENLELKRKVLKYSAKRP